MNKYFLPQPAKKNQEFGEKKYEYLLRKIKRPLISDGFFF